MKIKSPKDFWSGLMFIGSGLFFAVWALTHYQMGTAVRMGPAYFPTVLGGLLVVLGLIILLGALAIEGPAVPQFFFRPLFMISLGLVGATAALVFVGALGGHEFKWKEVTILYVILILFSWLVFVKGLSLPFPLWPAAYS